MKGLCIKKQAGKSRDGDSTGFTIGERLPVTLISRHQGLENISPKSFVLQAGGDVTILQALYRVSDRNARGEPRHLQLEV